MERMIVIAPKGKTCPMERSRALVGDKEDITVPNNHYYRSRIASGELVFKGHVGQPAAIDRKTITDRKSRGGTK